MELLIKSHSGRISIPAYSGDYSSRQSGIFRYILRLFVNTDSILITPELLALLSEIDEFKGAWRLLGTLAPNRLNALRRVATIESIGSSTRIEGSQLTDREVEQLLSKLEIKKLEGRDEQEVAGYAEVMETVFHAFADILITENHLKQLHRDLLRYSVKDERHRGEYKTLPNNVGAFDKDGQMISIVFETASPFDTPRRMAGLLDWLKNARELGRIHPLLIVAVFIVNFLKIHPFQDGNGRMSRILTTLLLLQAGYVYVPYSSLESVIENSNDGYYLALRETQKTIHEEAPNWQPWLMFFMRALQQQKRHLAIKIERERNALTALSELSISILDYVRGHGRVTTRDMVRETGASPNTLKATFTNLVNKKLLIRHGGGRSTWYGLL
jgi:Fic family protein